ncbi:MAG: PilX N-terminal domain-containing pilus assembly protein [Colwellia sp.]|nr:PilX N-terminal domain-containing pilus assembly protein [Colwellia sp.]
MVINVKKESGFVLVVALVFLVALTGVASALMLNTTSDMKMSGASQEKLIATQEALGAVDEAISLQLAPGASNLFLETVFPEEGTPVVVTALKTTASITNANSPDLEPDCGHLTRADDNTETKCNWLRLTVTKVYGNNDTSSVVVNAGIVQQARAKNK